MKKIILITMAILISSPCFASTQTRFAGTGASVDRGNSGFYGWSSPGNITADDGSNTSAGTMNIGAISDSLEATNFGFTIPIGAKINGITVKYERYGSALNEVSDYSVNLLKGDGSGLGVTNKSTGAYWTATTPTIDTFGGSNQLWGNTWSAKASSNTDADNVNSVNFGASLAIYTWGEPGVGTVDYVQITIDYTAAITGIQSIQGITSITL